MRIVRLALLMIAALAAVPLPASAEILITIDKTAQRMMVAVDGSPRWTWPVSTGRRGYATPSGSFTGTVSNKAPDVRIANDGKTVVNETR